MPADPTGCTLVQQSWRGKWPTLRQFCLKQARHLFSGDETILEAWLLQTGLPHRGGFEAIAWIPRTFLQMAATWSLPDTYTCSSPGTKKKKAALSMPSSKLLCHQGLHTDFSPENPLVYLTICGTSFSTNASCCVF